jgi:hypothetical protein
LHVWNDVQEPPQSAVHTNLQTLGLGSHVWPGGAMPPQLGGHSQTLVAVLHWSVPLQKSASVGVKLGSLKQGGGVPLGFGVVSTQYLYETAPVATAPGRHVPKNEIERAMPSKSKPFTRLRGMSFMLHDAGV